MCVPAKGIFGMSKKNWMCFSFSKGNLFKVHTNTWGLGYISDFFARYVGVQFVQFPSDRRLKELE